MTVKAPDVDAVLKSKVQTLVQILVQSPLTTTPKSSYNKQSSESEQEDHLQAAQHVPYNLSVVVYCHIKELWPSKNVVYVELHPSSPTIVY